MTREHLHAVPNDDGDGLAELTRLAAERDATNAAHRHMAEVCDAARRTLDALVADARDDLDRHRPLTAPEHVGKIVAGIRVYGLTYAREVRKIGGHVTGALQFDGERLVEDWRQWLTDGWHDETFAYCSPVGIGVDECDESRSRFNALADRTALLWTLETP